MNFTKILPVLALVLISLAAVSCKGGGSAEKTTSSSPSVSEVSTAESHESSDGEKGNDDSFVIGNADESSDVKPDEKSESSFTETSQAENNDESSDNNTPVQPEEDETSSDKTDTDAETPIIEAPIIPEETTVFTTSPEAPTNAPAEEDIPVVTEASSHADDESSAIELPFVPIE